MSRRRPKKSAINPLEGSFLFESDTKELFALLNEGKIEEFRRRLEAERLQEHREMYKRILAGASYPD